MFGSDANLGCRESSHTKGAFSKQVTMSLVCLGSAMLSPALADAGLLLFSIQDVERVSW